MLSLVGLAIAVVDSAAAQPARIAVVYAAGEAVPVADLRRAAAQSGVAVQLDAFGVGAGTLPLPADSVWARYDLVLVDTSLDSAGVFVAPLRAAAARTRAFRLSGVTAPSLDSPSDHPWVNTYWGHPSVENHRNLFRYLVTRVLVRPASGVVAAAPVVYGDAGFYHPDAPGLFDTWEAFAAWREAHRGARATLRADVPRIGLNFNLGTYTRGLHAPMDSLVREIERQGGEAITLVSRRTAPYREHLVRNNRPIVDVLLFEGERIHQRSFAEGLEEVRSLGVPVLAAHVHSSLTAAQIDADPLGLVPAMTPNIVNTEQSGVFEPLLVAAKATSPSDPRTPEVLPAQVAWRVARAMAWARLRRASPADRRVVFTFWSEGAGKANVGGDPDDFLDVPASLAVLLRRMHADGYDVGTAPLPDRDTLAWRMSREASNVGTWAPGELAERVRRGQVALLPAATYRRWFDSLPARRRSEIIAMWGEPPGDVMVHRAASGESVIVIPTIRLGNVLIAPHPDWGYQMSNRALMSTGALPPHHQYLAFFLWMQREYKAHAWVSMFSNIVLQPGKAEGPMADDHVGILLGATPHIHPERLGANGGLSSKRKGLALPISWYNIVAPAEAQGRLGDLRARIGRLEMVRDTALQRVAIGAIRQAVDSLQLTEALGITAETPADTIAARVERYADRLTRELMPYGAKVLGDAPRDTALADMITAMLGSALPEALGADTSHGTGRTIVRDMIGTGIDARVAAARAGVRGSSAADSVLSRVAAYRALLETAPRETEALLEALAGRWIEPGPMEEPTRRPEALPPGRFTLNFDPRVIPTPEAEVLGRRLAEDMVVRHRAANAGASPTRFAFVLWSGEITKSYGVIEAEILHLLGVRMVRNTRGEIDDVALIPRDSLGRARVDVLISTSGTYRDHFQDKVNLIARAVALAASSPEADNPVSRTTAAGLAAATTRGLRGDSAIAFANARVFAPAPNAYSPSIQFLAKSGDQRGDEARMADLFLNRMSHAYGAGLYGAAAKTEFQSQLRTLDAAVLSRSGAVNSLLDNPMPAGFLGGLDLATRAVRGRGTQLLITTLKDQGEERTETVRQVLSTELDTRYFNRKFVEKLIGNGYDGARNMMFMTDHLDLWDTTSPDAVTSRDWSRVKQVYVDDEFGLGLDAFFDRQNPFAQQIVLANLLGAAERGGWNATAAERTAVARRLARSVATHGNSCDAQLCRNEALTAMVERALDAAPDGAALSAAYRSSIDDARRAPRTLVSAPSVLRTSSSVSKTLVVRGASHSSAAATEAVTVQAAPAAAPRAPHVTGRVLQEQPSAVVPSDVGAVVRSGALVVLGAAAVTLMLIGWRREGGGRTR